MKVHGKSWPDPPAGGPLGDGRLATARRRPTNLDELCQAVGESASAGLAIYPQGGGTALDYGGIPVGLAWRSTPGRFAR